MRYQQTALLVGSLLALIACEDGLSGNYQDADGMTRYQFFKDGQALVSVLGSTVSAEYKLDNNKVFLTSPQGTVVLTRKGENLYGPMGLELTQKN